MAPANAREDGMAARKDFSNAPSTGEALKDPNRAAEVKGLLAGTVDLHVP